MVGKRTFILFVVFLVLFTVSCTQENKKKKSQAEAIRNVGEALLREGKYSAALRELMKSEKMNDQDSLLHYYMGHVYMQKNRLDLAVERYKRAIELKPDFAGAKNDLGVVYLKKGEIDTAIALFEEVNEEILYASPHNPLFNLGRAYYMKKDYKKAEEYLQEALDLEPRFVPSKLWLGRVYRKTGRVDEALKLLEKTVKKDPLFAIAHFDLGEIYEQSGQPEKAVESYNRVIELIPEDPLAAKAETAIKRLQ